MGKYLININLKGKTAVVTGATKGIGRAAAIALHQVGANIIALGRNDKELTSLKKKLKKRIKTIRRSLNTEQVKKAVCIITDIRYAEYEKDEAYWLQKELKGKLVHISKYNKDYTFNQGKVSEVDRFVGPPNLAETTQDPKIRKISDVRLFWQHCEGDPKKDENLKNAVQEVINLTGVI